MSTGGSFATKLAPAVTPELAARLKKAEPVAQAKAIDISANPIAQIIKADPRPEAAVPKLVDALAPKTTAQAKQALKDLEAFKEYTAAQRISMKQRLLALVSDKTFAQMAETYGSMNSGNIEIRDMMKPMTDTLEALFTLRNAGENVVIDTFEEIEKDRKLESDWQRRTDALIQEQRSVKSDLDHIAREIRQLQENATWYRSNKGPIAAQMSQQQALGAKLAELKVKADAVANEQKDHNEAQGKYKAEKEQVRRMLDIKGEDHRKQMQALLKKADEYIENTKLQSATLRENLLGVVDQADNLVTINTGMVTVTATLDTAVEKALDKIRERVNGLKDAPAGEDTLGKINRERDKNDWERHTSSLLGASTGMKKTLASLQTDAVDANNFRDGVIRQQTTLAETATDGIGDLASGIHSTIFAINTSALNETQAAINVSLTNMNRENTNIMNKAVIKAAVDLDDTQKRLLARVETLRSTADSLAVANQLRTQGMEKIMEASKQMVDTTADMRQRLQESIGMDAEFAGSLKEIGEAKTPEPNIQSDNSDKFFSGAR